MLTRSKDIAEAALHVLLAANHLSHQPNTPESVIAVLAYLGLAAMTLSQEEDSDD